MDIINDKLDMIIKLLEDLVDNTQVIELDVDENLNDERVALPRDVMIQIPNIPRSRSLSFGEDGSVDERVEMEYENSHFNNLEIDGALHIGQKHRIVEEEDDRGILHLYIQYWDDMEEEWKNIHKF